MTTAKVLLDSVCIETGCRLTTFELSYPRIIHSELMTHKRFSRNAGSSRAIPSAKLRQMVKEHPFFPSAWGSNQRGMQAGDALPLEVAIENNKDWQYALDVMLEVSRRLADRGTHKQLANRLLEPFQYITVIVSATELANFFHLRYHPDAQPEFQDLAKKMFRAYSESNPQRLLVGEWHTPLINGKDQKELDMVDLLKVSTGRCARVSYLTHDGRRDTSEDIALHDRLVSSGHWSPFEHVAQALPGPYSSGNFVGWHQYRKNFHNENVTTFDEPAAA